MLSGQRRDTDKVRFKIMRLSPPPFRVFRGMRDWPNLLHLSVFDFDVANFLLAALIFR
jgi:hypothetical protein